MRHGATAVLAVIATLHTHTVLYCIASYPDGSCRPPPKHGYDEGQWQQKQKQQAERDSRRKTAIVVHLVCDV